jgi:nucleotide-binding universal stress UspA family protein
MDPIPGPLPVVVGVDGSRSSELAVEWAAKDAGQRQLPILLVSAWNIDFPAQILDWLPDHMDGLCGKSLEAARVRAEGIAPWVTVTTHIDRGHASWALVSASLRADTVVVGSAGLGTAGSGAAGLGTVRRFLSGSTAMQVAAHARCPVVVVPATPAHPPRSGDVVVGVDGSDVSTDAVEYAFAEASQRKRELTVIHAWDISMIQDTISLSIPSDVSKAFEDGRAAVAAEAVAGWAEKYPDVIVHTQLVRGRPVEALVDASSRAELLVVGSRGHGGFRGLLLGSVSRRVLHLAGCPVAVVRSHTRGQSQPE